jgi:hypothetical protein
MENSLHKQALKAYKSLVLIAAKNKAGELQFKSQTQADAFAISTKHLREMLDYVATGDEDLVRKIYTKTIIQRSQYWVKEVA